MTTFFQALKPLSHRSGINSSHYSIGLFPSKELLDVLAHENIKMQWNKNLFWYEIIDATHRCLIGEHYEHVDAYPRKSLLEKIIAAIIRPQVAIAFIVEELYNSVNKKQCSKGVLDFLIFPLLSRKLVSDTRSPARKNTPIINTVALAIAIPLEVLRHSIGLALTLSLAPLVLFIHSMRSLLNFISPEVNDYTNVEHEIILI